MAGKKVASTKTPVKPYNRTEHDGKESGGKVKIKWVVSFISCTDGMRQTIRGLGLRGMAQVVERQDTPAARGRVHARRRPGEQEEESKGEKKVKSRDMRPHTGIAQAGDE